MQRYKKRFIPNKVRATQNKMVYGSSKRRYAPLKRNYNSKVKIKKKMQRKRNYVNRKNKLPNQDYFRILSNTSFNNINNYDNNNSYQALSVQSIKRKLALMSPPIKTVPNYTGMVDVSNTITPFGLGVFPPKGATATTRIGADIMLKSLELRYTFEAVSTALHDDYNICRITLVQFTGQNADGAYPSVPPTAVGSSNMVFAQTASSYSNNNLFNSQTKQEYRILYDKTHTVSTIGPFASSGHIMITRFPVSKLHFLVDASDVNLPALSEGLIFLFITSDSSVAPHPRVQFNSKLNFTDT